MSNGLSDQAGNSVDKFIREGRLEFQDIEPVSEDFGEFSRIFCGAKKSFGRVCHQLVSDLGILKRIMVRKDQVFIELKLQFPHAVFEGCGVGNCGNQREGIIS